MTFKSLSVKVNHLSYAYKSQALRSHRCFSLNKSDIKQMFGQNLLKVFVQTFVYCFYLLFLST